MEYLTPESTDAFLDFPDVDRSKWAKNVIECPICKGHGGWNLRINAYPLHNIPNTVENRHLKANFRSSCGSCWGHGYLQPGQTCPHEWSVGKKIGNCLHEWICSKCGIKQQVDSSG